VSPCFRGSWAMVLVGALASGSPALRTGSAFAESPDRRVGFELFAGYQSYEMSDVNAALANFGTVYAGATGSAGEIHGGSAFGGALRARMSSRAVFGLEVISMRASSQGMTDISGLPYRVTVEIPALGGASTVEYRVLGRGRLRAGLGAGIGYYVTTGMIRLRHSFTEVRADLDAHSLGAHAGIFGEVLLASDLAGRISIGYRHIKAGSIRGDEREVRELDGNRVAPDWSGPMVRLALAYH